MAPRDIPHQVRDSVDVEIHYLLVFSPSGFLFSSRGRHTSCLSDWSSDVCSSDLVAMVSVVVATPQPMSSHRPLRSAEGISGTCRNRVSSKRARVIAVDRPPHARATVNASAEIGRAAWRERV